MREGGRKLNLVMTYPIRWGMRHIMEDYIQNFYDVIGAERFANDFIYSYDESRRELRMEGRKGFHVEWLQYIGASTKGEGSAHHMAGKFGEGFKIASLCAYRDYKVSVHMESRDWALDVLKMPGEIDGQSMEFLGYDIKERVYQDDAILLLGNVGPEAYQNFLEAIQRFFYPENPSFGECLAYTWDYAVYRIKDFDISGGQRIKGKVFASMQERAEIHEVPLIFCNHSYEPDKEDDRDRERFHFHDIESAVTEIVVRLEGEALRKVFMEFQPHWRRTGGRAAAGPDWGRLIREMVWQICDDHAVREKVYEYLKDHYIADVGTNVIKWDKNKYKTAMSWFRMSKFYGTYKLLPYYFSDLGIDTIYSLCEKYDGFHMIDEPDEQQRNRIQILEKMARDIFPDIICYEKLPECRVIVNKGTPDEGFARTNDTDAPLRNEMGLKVINDITEINLRETLFCKDAFPETMVVYMHELLHQFGGDASRQFRTAILAMDYRIMQNFRKLEEYESVWKELE